MRILEYEGGVGPDAAAQEDPEALELGQVVAQATDGARGAQVAGPQPQVLLADAEAHGRHVRRERRRDDPEHVAVTWVREQELIAAVE